MSNPQKVIGFLDISGEWDPSLAFVMLGAIFVNSIFYYFGKKRKSPILATKFLVPTKKDIDRRLVIGSGLFGIGWAITGFCPGPLLVSLLKGQVEIVIAFLSLLAGMAVFDKFLNKY